jgi:hypothetical protein
MPKTSSDDFVKAIKETYDCIQDHFDEIYAQCKTPGQRQTLRDLLAAARDAFWHAVAKALVDHNSVVMGIKKQLEETNGEIQKGLQGLKDVTEFLKLATEAVKLAAALAVLAAAA